MAGGRPKGDERNVLGGRAIVASGVVLEKQGNVVVKLKDHARMHQGD